MYVCTLCLFFFIILLPPRSTLTVTLFPYTSLFRSLAGQHGTALGVAVARRAACGGRDRRAGLLPHLGRRRGGRHRRHRVGRAAQRPAPRSEEHTSELQSLMRNSHAVFCLKKKKQDDTDDTAVYSD